MKATAKDNANLDSSTQLVDAIEDGGRQSAAARDGIGQVIFGQAQVIEETLITLLAGGHLLLIGASAGFRSI